MLIELPLLWLIVADCVAWAAIHLGVAYFMTRLPSTYFDNHWGPRGWLFRLRNWERRGLVYQQLFAVDKWKRHLPDGAALFKKGFRKKRLLSNRREYLRRFRTETCRAELTHWLVMFCAPWFALWNPAYIMPWMVGYAVVANLPFIFVQRYNRYRFNRVLHDDPAVDPRTVGFARRQPDS